MKRHPVSDAFDQAADPPSTKFRDDLRARLLADLGAPQAAVTFQPDPNHPPQEITVTTDNSSSPSRPRGPRVLLGVAAAVIVIVGVTAVVLTRNNQDSNAGSAEGPTVTVADTVAATTTSSTTTTSSITTTAPRRDDATIAAALLLTPPTGSFGKLQEFEIMRGVVECADVVAALDPAEAAASNSGNVYQWVNVFPTKEAAASAMAAVTSPAGQSCQLTIDKAVSGASADGGTAEIVDAPSPAAQGDSQVSWVVNVSDNGTSKFYKRTVWVQVDRSLVYIQVVGDLTDASFNQLDKSLGDAVELATAELAAG